MGVLMIEDRIFNQLVELNDEFYTKADFSREYLGKCRTYYNAIKTNNKTVSKTALVYCWNRLRNDVKACDDRLAFTKHNWMVESVKERRAKLDIMSRWVLEALIEQDAMQA